MLAVPMIDLKFPQMSETLQINYMMDSYFILSLSFQANGDASLGKYVAGSVAGASGDKGLFVANHAY